MKEEELALLAWISMSIDPENPNKTKPLEERCLEAIQELHKLIDAHICDPCPCLGMECDGDYELCSRKHR